MPLKSARSITRYFMEKSNQSYKSCNSWKSYPDNSRRKHSNNRTNNNVWRNNKNPYCDVKGIINNMLSNFVDFESLTNAVKSELQNMDTSSASFFLETLISLSLHEIFDNELIEKIKIFYETDGHKFIHKAVWPQYKNKDIKNNKIKFENLSRSDDDLYKTISLCLRAGLTPLDVNHLKETGIGSLINSCYEKHVISEEVFNKAYDIMTTPTPENVKSMCTLMVNKINDCSENINKKNAPIISWLINTSESVFCDTLIKNLIILTKGGRDSDGYYRKVHDTFVLMRKILKLGPTNDENREFDRYFSLHPETTNEILWTNFINRMINICYDLDLENQKDKLNIDIIGAIIGEITTIEKTISYCLKRFDNYPTVVITCLVHKKKGNQDFICPPVLVDKFVNLHNTSISYIKFQIINCLEILFGRKIKNISDLSTIESTKSTVNISINKDIQIENPYDGKIDIQGILSLKDEKIEFDDITKTYSPDIIDDVYYGLSKLIDSAKESKTIPQLMEVIISKAMEQIQSEKQIDAFVQIFKDNNWLPWMQELVSIKGVDLLASNKLDNPKYAEKVMDAFLPKTKPISPKAPRKRSAGKQLNNKKVAARKSSNHYYNKKY